MTGHTTHEEVPNVLVGTKVLTLTLLEGLIDSQKHEPNPKRRTARITPRSEDQVERRRRRMNRLTD